MIDVRNNGNLTCGLVADPEFLGADNNVVRLRVAADFAGNDRSPDANERTKNTGYFNVTMFLNEDNQNSRFVKSQIEKGNLKKGSQVQILYRLQHDRWEKDGQKASAVTLIAESITYAAGNRSESTAESSNTQTASADIPDQF